MPSVVMSRPAGRPSGVAETCSERRHIHWWYVASALVALTHPPVGAGHVASIAGDRRHHEARTGGRREEGHVPRTDLRRDAASGAPGPVEVRLATWYLDRFGP